MRPRSSLLSAFFILFLDNLGFTLIYPLLPIFILHENLSFLSSFGEMTKNVWVGLALIAFPFGMFFGSPFFGSVSDQFGRKKILYLTLFGSIFGAALTGFGILFKSYFLILISRLFAGFFSANLSLCLAIIADLKKDKRIRSKYFSLASACLGLSWLCALLLSSLFINFPKLAQIHASFVFWVIALFGIINLLVLKFFFTETAYPIKKNHFHIGKCCREILETLERRQLRVSCLTLFFWFFGFYISLQWITPLSLEIFHASKITVLWILVLLGVLWTLASTFLNPLLLKEYSLWKILTWSLFLISLFYFFSGITNFFLYFVISYLISGIFASIAWGNSISLISLASIKEEQGKSLGLSQSVMAIAQFFGPFFGGLVAGVDMKALFIFSALFVFIGFLFLLVFIIQKRNRLAKTLY